MDYCLSGENRAPEASDLSWRRKMVKHGEVATFAARCTEAKSSSFLLDGSLGPRGMLALTRTAVASGYRCKVSPDRKVS